MNVDLALKKCVVFSAWLIYSLVVVTEKDMWFLNVFESLLWIKKAVGKVVSVFVALKILFIVHMNLLS